MEKYIVIPTEEDIMPEITDVSDYTPERALVIVAHADDIEFGMSGTISRWTAAGAQVTYCIVTDNSAGSNAPDADLEVLVATRREEQIASAKVAGVHDVRFLNYKDGTLQPTMHLRRELTRIVREIKPHAVLTLDPTTVFAMGNGYINHPDHRAVGEAAIYAVFPSAGTRPIFPELLDEGLEPHDTDKVFLVLSAQDDVVVNISNTFETKADALRCHQSQISEDAIEMIRKWNREAGEKYGFEYAETFKVINLKRDDESNEQEDKPQDVAINA
jgi:LmbE family N-acetylglucosaminyl deacetylase